MAKNELKRIDVTTTGDITITENGLRLGDNWTDLDNVFSKAFGLNSDESIEPIKFNGKITIIVEEIGTTASNLTFKSTMTECQIVVDDLSYDKKLSDNNVKEIIDYMDGSYTYNGRLYLCDKRFEYSQIEELTVLSGQYEGTYTAPIKPIEIES